MNQDWRERKKDSLTRMISTVLKQIQPRKVKKNAVYFYKTHVIFLSFRTLDT